MEEFAKIVRVLKKIDPEAPQETWIVLDATTGQNAITQIEEFKKITDITGIIMTKLDGTAKGGVLVAIADQFKIPIVAIGVGEKEDDLNQFNADEYARALIH
jgi:fused signal recognition particle receptor